MSYTKVQTLLNVLDALPHVFNVQPSNDYAKLVSRSPSDVASQAWARTAKQLREATQHFEQLNPEVVDLVDRLSKVSSAIGTQPKSERLQRLVSRAKELDQLKRCVEERLQVADEMYLQEVSSNNHKGQTLGQD